MSLARVERGAGVGKETFKVCVVDGELINDPFQQVGLNDFRADPYHRRNAGDTRSATSQSWHGLPAHGHSYSNASIEDRFKPERSDLSF